MPDTQTNPPGSSREALLSSPPVPQDSPAGAAVGSAIPHITGPAHAASGPSYTSSPIHGLLNPLSQALGPPHASPDDSITLKPKDQSTFISASPSSPASHLQGLHTLQSSAPSLPQPPQKMPLPSPPDEQQQQQQEPSNHSSRKTSRSATAQLLVRARLAGVSMPSQGEERDTDLLLPSRGGGKPASFGTSDGQRTGSEYHAFHVGEPGSAGTSNGLLSRFAGDDDEESALLQPHETSSSPLGGGPGEEDRTGAAPGWHSKVEAHSLQEAYATVPFPPASAPFFQKLLAFSGLGLLVSIGYCDPGNWATDLAGGSSFGYALLSVVLLSNCCAMLLQHLALKLGVAAERDLAQACRDAYPPYLNYMLWVLAEIAIAATDVAEVIGTAIALQLLFGLPLWAGVLLTAFDVLVTLAFEDKSFRSLEIFVGALTLLIAVCFLYEMIVSKPNWGQVALGYIPHSTLLTDPHQLYISIGILGATVMPHNLYLHSSIVQTRAYPRTAEGKAMAISFGTLDSTLSLFGAFAINSAILILAAAAFHFSTPARTDVTDIGVAYELLAPSLGAKAASIMFGVALLASGQNSTITGTLSGQIVMEGFLRLKMRPWLRRMITRGMAIIPAALVAATTGKDGVGKLLVMSQVVLSLQLTFAIVPLVHLTSSRAHMGAFANGWAMQGVAWALTLVIAALNIYLVVAALLWDA
ncbi:MAG: hypothetical protein WDW36_001517 [Sanguina aurantia]